MCLKRFIKIPSPLFVASLSLLPVGWRKAAKGPARLIINWSKPLSARHKSVFLLYDPDQPLIGRVNQGRIEIEPKYLRKHVKKRFLQMAISSKSQRRYKPTMSKFDRIISEEESAPATHRIERTRRRLDICRADSSSKIINKGTESGVLWHIYFGGRYSRQRKRKVSYIYMIWEKTDPHFVTRVQCSEHSRIQYRMILRGTRRPSLVFQLTKTWKNSIINYD